MKLLKNILIYRKYSKSLDFKPKCKDCKNYIKYIDNGKEIEGLGNCRINGYDSKYGKVYFYSITCRYTELYCGEKGKYFEKI